MPVTARTREHDDYLLFSDDSAVIPVIDRLLGVYYGATYDDWWNLSNAKSTVELIDDRLIFHPSVSLEYARARGYLLNDLSGQAEANGLRLLNGPFTMSLGRRRKFQPDFMLVDAANAANLTEHWLDGPADLVIELTSTASHAYDLTEKRHRYAQAGVPEYWIIDLQRQLVLVDRPAGERVREEASGIVKPSTFCEVKLDVGAIWQGLR